MFKMFLLRTIHIYHNNLVIPQYYKKIPYCLWNINTTQLYSLEKITKIVEAIFKCLLLCSTIHGKKLTNTNELLADIKYILLGGSGISERPYSGLWWQVPNKVNHYRLWDQIHCPGTVTRTIQHRSAYHELQ